MENRVRKNTSMKVNQQIDKKIKENIERYSVLNADAITTRIEELDKEWDIERMLEVNMSTLALSGIALTVFHHRRWLILPSIVLVFFAQHALQGWCPPLPILRKLGYRTKEEILQEKYALKALRGDFNQALKSTSDINPLEIYTAVTK